MSVDCPHRTNPHEEYSLCAIGKIESHIDLCHSCIDAANAAGETYPSRRKMNRHLGSVVHMGYLQGAHRDASLAKAAVIEIVRSQVVAAGIDFNEWIKTNKLPAIGEPPALAPRCLHLGRETKRVGCACWQESTHACTARGGLAVVPVRDCPCPQGLYEIKD